MSDPVIRVDVAEAVGRVRADRVAYQQRQMVAITLHAIAMMAHLQTKMSQKRGGRMGRARDRPRQTTGIDWSTALAQETDAGDKVQGMLDRVLGYQGG